MIVLESVAALELVEELVSLLFDELDAEFVDAASFVAESGYVILPVSG
jgi:hypothetical protein